MGQVRPGSKKKTKKRTEPFFTDLELKLIDFPWFKQVSRVRNKPIIMRKSVII